MTQDFSGFINEIIIDAWQKCFGVFPHGGRIADGVQRGKIEKGIPMIEQWRGGDNLVGMAVHEKAEVAEMPVNIVNKRIEDNHVIERLDIFPAEFFIVFTDRLHAAAFYNPTDWYKGQVLGGEQLTDGTKPSFPFGKLIGDGV